MKKKKLPVCKSQPYCFANKHGSCQILKDTEFKNRECPFWKSDLDINLEVQEAECRFYQQKNTI